ncbi:uncharacterized protein TNCT_590461, partial [Trichonephila clavata]
MEGRALSISKATESDSGEYMCVIEMAGLSYPFAHHLGSRIKVTYVELRLEDEITIPTKSETLPADLSHLKSGWQPTAEEDEEAPRIGFYRRKQSWVGVYVEGTDYWSKRDSTEDIKPVEFEMDQKGQAWYDIPVAEEVMVEVPLDKKRMISRSKLDELKNRTSQDLLKNADQ